MHFPRDYRDFSGAHAVAGLAEGEHASIAGDVSDVGTRTLVSGRQMLTVVVAVGSDRVRAVWFNMPFMARRFAVGMRVAIAGTPKRRAGIWEFAHPEVRWLAEGEDPHASEWLAIYPLSEGVQQSHVRLAVRAALDHAAAICPEAFSDETLATKNLLPIERALREMHAPSGAEGAAAARRRFVYQELFMLQLALRMQRGRQQERRAAPMLPVDARLDSRIRARFGFEFTPAQCLGVRRDRRRHRPQRADE